MPTPLPIINMAPFTVGSMGTIDLTTCAPTSSPAYIGKPGLLQLYNESAAGLRLTFRLTGGGVDLPAGGWGNVQIDAGELFVDFTIAYLLPNPGISVLLATYFAPNEVDQAAIAVSLGNSPINIGNAVPVSTASNSLTNDGNASGTTFIESTPSGGAQSWLGKNDGTLVLSPLSNALQPAALQIVAGGGAGVFAQVQMDGNQINTNGQGTLLAKRITVTSDRFLWNGAVGGGTHFIIDILPSDGKTHWAIIEGNTGFLELSDQDSGLNAARWNADMSGQMSNNQIQWDTAGNVTLSNVLEIAGSQESGHFFTQFVPPSTTVWGFWVPFRMQKTNSPSNITLSNIGLTNCTAAIGAITKFGFILNLTPTAGNTLTVCNTDWVTVGN